LSLRTGRLLSFFPPGLSSSRGPPHLPACQFWCLPVGWTEAAFGFCSTCRKIVPALLHATTYLPIHAPTIVPLLPSPVLTFLVPVYSSHVSRLPALPRGSAGSERCTAGYWVWPSRRWVARGRSPSPLRTCRCASSTTRLIMLPTPPCTTFTSVRKPRTGTVAPDGAIYLVLHRAYGLAMDPVSFGSTPVDGHYLYSYILQFTFFSAAALLCGRDLQHGSSIAIVPPGCVETRLPATVAPGKTPCRRLPLRREAAASRYRTLPRLPDYAARRATRGAAA